MLNCTVRVTYPKVLPSMEVGPWGMFSMTNVPLTSVVAHKSIFDTLTMAYDNGCKVCSSITRPDTLKRPSMAIDVADMLFSF